MPTINSYAQAEENAVIKFIANVHQEFQSGMLLDGKVTKESGFTGARVDFPVFEPVEATRRQAGRDVTAAQDVQTAAQAEIQDWNLAQYVPAEVIRKVQYKAISSYAERCKMGIGRRADQITLDALGSVTGGLEVAQTVSKTGQTGDLASGFNQAKVLRAKALMDGNDVPMGSRYLALTAQSLADALSQTEFSSSDFIMQMNNLNNGEIAKYAGFEFVMIPERGNQGVGRLPLGTVSSGKAIRTLYAWHRDAVGCGVSRDIGVEMNYIAEKTAYLVNATYDAGATIIDRKGVVSISVNEAYTAPIKSTN